MFKRFLKTATQAETRSPNTVASQKAATRQELALRARIADKLKHYDASQDTSTSRFTLAGDEPRCKRETSAPRVAAGDAWGQADPREAGRWNKENRRNRPKPGLGILR